MSTIPLPHVFAEVCGVKSLDQLSQPVVCRRCKKTLAPDQIRFITWVTEALYTAGDSATTLCDECSEGWDEIIRGYLGPWDGPDLVREDAG